MDDVTRLLTQEPKGWCKARIREPWKYLACRITTGSDWWDLDDELAALPGRVALSTNSQWNWHLIPIDQAPALIELTERRPGRLRACRVLSC